jgi:hypothetical protein
MERSFWWHTLTPSAPPPEASANDTATAGPGEAAAGDDATAGLAAGAAEPSRASKSARARRALADIWVRPVSQRFTVAKDTPSR